MVNSTHNSHCPYDERPLRTYRKSFSFLFCHAQQQQHHHQSSSSSIVTIGEGLARWVKEKHTRVEERQHAISSLKKRERKEERKKNIHRFRAHFRFQNKIRFCNVIGISCYTLHSAALYAAAVAESFLLDIPAVRADVVQQTGCSQSTNGQQQLLDRWLTYSNLL